MKKLFAIFLVTLFVLLSGCATNSMLSFMRSDEEKAYIAKADSTETKFFISKDKEKEAWARAQTWIAKYSSMNLQIVNDNIIQTEDVGKYSGVLFGYSVTKMNSNDKVQIEVKCYNSNMFSGADANQNARFLSYYIKTGELPPTDKIIKK